MTVNAEMMRNITKKPKQLRERSGEWVGERCRTTFSNLPGQSRAGRTTAIDVADATPLIRSAVPNLGIRVTSKEQGKRVGWGEGERGKE